jgi:hypothetical protein
MPPLTRDRGFESCSLQHGVWCELAEAMPLRTVRMPAPPARDDGFWRRLALASSRSLRPRLQPKFAPLIRTQSLVHRSQCRPDDAIPAHPTDPLAINSKASAALVGQLYKELMEWNPPWGPSATNDASLRGHC